jgi:N-acetylglucosamine-6-phosphate deacetylase
MSAILGRRYDSGEVCRIRIADGYIVDMVPVDGRTVGGAESLPWIAPDLVDLQINGYGGQEFSSAALTVEQVVRATA